MAVVFVVLALRGGGVDVDQAGETAVDPSELPQQLRTGEEVVDPGSIREARNEGGSVFLESQKTWVQWVSMQPEPDGVFDVEGPRSRTAVGDGGVLEIVADRGRFLVPDRQPRSGAFIGNVTINLYQGRDGLPPRYGEDVDVVGRAYLDEVRFDLELGLLETDGPMHVTGPAFDFKGEGLLVRFNQLADRLEELRIDRSDGLRLKLDGMGSMASDDVSDSGTGGDPGASEVVDEAGTGVLYSMLVDGGIQGVIRGGEAVLRGERVDVLYRTGETGGSGESLSSLNRNGGGAGGREPERADGRVVGGPGRSLCPVSDDDTLVSWSGMLVVRPAEPEMAFAAVEAGALVGRLVGEPSVLESEAGEVVAGAIGYSSEGAEVWALPLDEGDQVRLSSSEVGVVIAERLSYLVRERRAEFAGPGVWEAPTEAETEMGARDLVWSDALRFTLSAERGSNGVLGRLLEGEVTGAVGATHAEGHLEAERLALIRLDDQTAAVLAEGGLIGTYAPERWPGGEVETEPVRLVSEEAELMLEERDGRLDPTRLRATGGARLVQAGMLVAGETLTGELGRTGDHLKLERFTAEDRVRAQDGSRDVDLKGDRLELLPAEGWARLTGGEERRDWAEVRQSRSAVRGSLIEVYEGGDVVKVLGAGQGEHVIPGLEPDLEPVADPLLPGLEVRDRRELLDLPDTTIVLDWLGGMTFNRPSGWAEATGGVRGTYVKGDERGRASGQELRVELEGEVDEGSMAFTMEDADSGVRTLLLSGDAEVAWARESEEHGDASVTLHGPTIAYDRPSMEAAVVGAGWMLYEGEGVGNDESVGSSSVVELMPGEEGLQRGLLSWKDVLTLDLTTDRATSLGGVEMIYETGVEDPAVYLDARRAVAQFERLSLTGAGRARLLSIEALENVQVVREDRQITADGLRFEMAERMVELWGEDGGLVRQSGDEDVTGLAAKRVKWFLDRDEVDILQPAPVVVPVGGDRVR